MADTLKRVGPDRLTIETVPRAGLYGAQTPQVFRRDLLIEAYADRGRLGRADHRRRPARRGPRPPLRVVEGSPMNLKITTQADLRLAAAILKALPKPRARRPAPPVLRREGDVGEGAEAEARRPVLIVPERPD